MWFAKNLSLGGKNGATFGTRLNIVVINAEATNKNTAADSPIYIILKSVNLWQKKSNEKNSKINSRRSIE